MKDIQLGDYVQCLTSGVRGIVIKFYTPTACAEQIMVRTDDGRKYHAPTTEWANMKNACEYYKEF